jgi:formate dehydrogenase maturation protein FdhE
MSTLKAEPSPRSFVSEPKADPDAGMDLETRCAGLYCPLCGSNAIKPSIDIRGRAWLHCQTCHSHWEDYE